MPNPKESAAGRGAPMKEAGPRGANAPPEPTEAPEKPGAAALAALCADTSDYRRAATDLEYFGKYYLPHYFSLPAPPFHRELDALWRSRVMDGADPVRDACRILSKTGTRTAIAAPRGHAKSTVISLKNALHAALYGYKRYILLVSDTETQAVGFLDAIKSELEENPRILRDFGEQPGKKTWKTSSILLANGCRIDAVGSGQKLRGRRNHERRPDLILCDDIENDEGVRTAEQRDKLAAWFYKAVCKSGDRYTDILMIGTVLHHDALLARVLKNPGFQSRTYRAILSDSASPLWDDWERLYTDLADPKRERTAHAFFYRHRKEMLTGTRVLWPEKLSYYDLRVMRLAEGECAFQSEMLNQPVNPDDCLFSPQWFRFYSPAEVDFRAPRFRFYGYCDPSLGKSAQSDYSAIVTLAVDGDSGTAYVYDADLARRHPDRIISDILEKERLLRRETGRGYTLFGAETNQFQWFLKEQLARESAKAGLYLPIQGVRATEDKTLRVESLQPDIRNGYILFRRDQTLLLQQLSEFPLGAHDDGPDALEGAHAGAKGERPAQSRRPAPVSPLPPPRGRAKGDHSQRKNGPLIPPKTARAAPLTCHCPPLRGRCCPRCAKNCPPSRSRLSTWCAPCRRCRSAVRFRTKLT